MGLTTRKNYRTLLYVNTLALVILGAAISGWGIFRLLPAGLGENYGAIHAAVQEIRKALLWKIVTIHTAASLLILFGIVVLHLFYSHRIAGPVYRLGLEAARIGQGKLAGNIRFRQKDNLTDMADLLNNVAYEYRGRIDEVRAYLAVIEAESLSLADLVRQGRDRVALREAAEKITGSVKDIERSLSNIKT
jgi:methyl-accepting chemotaxis protein